MTECYRCVKQCVDTVAVVICIICGMGLCMDHLFRDELLVRHMVDWSLGEEEIEYARILPRFICGNCKAVIDGRRCG